MGGESRSERVSQVQEPVVFEVGVSRKKPENIRNRENPCPFCDVAHLTGLFRREGDRIWLMNKYRTLQHTVQTIVIESADHTGDPSTYSRAVMRGVLRFAVECFYAMRADPRFASVAMFKNYGPLSGGSLLHPHLQIVGFERADAYAHVGPENFSGIEVFSNENVAVTLSDHPVMGFVEINVGIDAAGLQVLCVSVGAGGGVAAMAGEASRAPEAEKRVDAHAWDAARGEVVPLDAAPDPALFMPWVPPVAPTRLAGAAARRVDALADAVQVSVRYLLTEHHGRGCTSYNLFFYPVGGKLWVKAMPRWVTSPYHIGYGITQVNCPAYMDDVRATLGAQLSACFSA